MFGKDPTVAKSFVCACLSGQLLACSNNGNGKWALLAAENLIFLVAINGWIIMTEVLWKIMEIVALCVWISMANFFREKIEKSGHINGYSQLNFSGCVC